MLAKNVNDNAGTLDERGALRFFASKLAPIERGRQSFSWVNSNTRSTSLLMPDATSLMFLPSI